MVKTDSAPSIMVSCSDGALPLLKAEVHATVGIVVMALHVDFARELALCAKPHLNGVRMTTDVRHSDEAIVQLKVGLGADGFEMDGQGH